MVSEEIKHTIPVCSDPLYYLSMEGWTDIVKSEHRAQNHQANVWVKENSSGETENLFNQVRMKTQLSRACGVGETDP